MSSSSEDHSTDRKPLYEHLTIFISGFVASAFAVSIVSAREYFSFYSDDLYKLMTFSDYAVFTIDFVTPAMMFFIVTLLIILAWGTVGVFAGGVFSFLYELVSRLLVGVFHRLFNSKKLNEIDDGFQSRLETMQLIAADSLRFSEGDDREETEAEIKKKFRFKLDRWISVFGWLFFTLLITTFVTRSDELSLAYVAVLAIGAIIGFLPIVRIFDAAYTRDYFVNDVRIRKNKEFWALSKSTQEKLLSAARETYQEKTAMRTIVAAGYTLASLLLLGIVYGEMRALIEHEKMVLYQSSIDETAAFSNQDYTDNHDRIFVRGNDLIRVVDQGVIAFNRKRTHVLFINDHGYIRAGYQPTIFLSDKSALKLSPEEIIALRKRSSYCFIERHPEARFFTLFEIRFLRFTQKQESCENLFDKHQNFLKKNSSLEISSKQ